MFAKTNVANLGYLSKHLAGAAPRKESLLAHLAKIMLVIFPIELLVLEFGKN